ncbi:MAG: hypothetical protein AAF679_12855 [Pseudomonadota bacterium]
MRLSLFQRLFAGRRHRKTRHSFADLPKSLQRDIGVIDGLPEGVLHRSS